MSLATSGGPTETLPEASLTNDGAPEPPPLAEAASDEDAAADDGGRSDDAADASANTCRIVAPGNAGGANCMPRIYECAAPISVRAIDCTAFCNVGQPASCWQTEDGGTTVYCQFGCGGRRPEGYVAPATNALASVGAFFASLSALEAASVDAFEILRDELVAHDAPSDLVGAAVHAAGDEVRHAKITRALAARYGRTAETQPVARPATRDLETIAIENAAEGCVRETFGALVAMHQAEHATDPAIRRAMRRIAQDEARHAELSWRLDEWFAERLSPDARARVDVAMRDAVDALAAEAAFEPATELQRYAGLPSGLASARLARALRATLWARVDRDTPHGRGSSGCERVTTFTRRSFDA